jgi:hypothetical protein
MYIVRKLATILPANNNFLKNESQTLVTFILQSQSQNAIILGSVFTGPPSAQIRFHLAFSIPLLTDNNTVRENAMRERISSAAA